MTVVNYTQAVVNDTLHVLFVQCPSEGFQFESYSIMKRHPGLSVFHGNLPSGPVLVNSLP